MLVNFRYVVEEFKKQKFAYRDIIRDVCEKMGNGMADYCMNAEFNKHGINTVAEYDLYCHYVAGVVGEGLTRMFVESQLGNPELINRPQLHESMGLFLQKTNIIRDIREDFDDGRKFYPREIWSKHVEQFEDLFKPEYREAALNCSAEMVYNALCHADECLFYLAGLKEQSVFNFCAIPQSMAIATLALCFRNPVMFERNIKIKKGPACQLMLESTQNLQVVCETFRRFVRLIRKKNKPQDPCFLRISIQCGKIEQFIESVFPSQTVQDAIAKQKQSESEQEIAARGEKQAAQSEARSDAFWLGVAVMGTLLFISAIMVGLSLSVTKYKKVNAVHSFSWHGLQGPGSTSHGTS